MENPIKMDGLGVPLFSETPICFNLSADFNHQAYLPERIESISWEKGTSSKKVPWEKGYC